MVNTDHDVLNHNTSIKEEAESAESRRLEHRLHCMHSLATHKHQIERLRMLIDLCEPGSKEEAGRKAELKEFLTIPYKGLCL